MPELAASFHRRSKIKYFAKRIIECITGYAVRYHVPPWEKREILFTFDDGPIPATLDILDLLDEYKKKAIFFLVALNVRKYPQIAREIVQRGHLIGSHGLAHLNMKKLSLSEFSRNVKQSFRIIEDVCGIKTRYFRPPFGQISFVQAIWAVIHGITLFFWSCGVSDSGELDFINPAVSLENKEKITKHRLIFLLHDYTPLDVVNTSLKELNN